MSLIDTYEAVIPQKDLIVKNLIIVKTCVLFPNLQTINAEIAQL